MEHAVTSWLAAFGAPALFALLAVGIVGFPLPDETMLVVAGGLVAAGTLAPVTTAIAAIGGALTGITLSYGLGRLAGFPLLVRYGSRLHLTATNIARARTWFERSGKWLLTGGYFIPGGRHVTALIAGATRLPAGTFMTFAYAGAVLWVSCFLTIGYVVGDNWRGLVADLHRHVLVACLIGVTVAVGFTWVRTWLRRWRRSD